MNIKFVNIEFCPADLKSNCPLMAAMLVPRIESRGPETVGISSNTEVSGPRPVPPESCRPVPSLKNRVTAHPLLRNSPANKSEYDLRSSNKRREPLCPEPREIAVLGYVSSIIKKQKLFIFHRINMKVPQMDSWYSPN